MRATYLLKESTGLVFLVNHIWRDRLACVSGCSAHIQCISYVDASMRAQAFVFRKSTQVCAGLMCIPANMDTLVCMHSFAQALRPNSSSCSCVHNCFVLRGNPNLWARAASRRKALMNSICEMKPSALISICRKTAVYCSGQK